ncbi:uncharacterized protein METZ01_LOCUS494915, partial [marine metagenome]
MQRYSLGFPARQGDWLPKRTWLWTVLSSLFLVALQAEEAEAEPPAEKAIVTWQTELGSFDRAS